MNNRRNQRLMIGMALVLLILACSSSEEQTAKPNSQVQVTLTDGEQTDDKIVQQPNVSSRVQVQMPSLPIYHYDGCWAGRAQTQVEALKGCRTFRKKGARWQRKFCRCAPADLIVIDEKTPIAFYTSTISEEYWVSKMRSEMLNFFGISKTLQGLVAECQEEEASYRKKYPEAHLHCEKMTVVPLFGPMKRTWEWHTYGDLQVHVYFNVEEGWWTDNEGMNPCFVAGTPIGTPQGEISIEDLAPGHEVIGWDLAREEQTVVTVLKVKRRPDVRVLLITTDGGGRIEASGNHPFWVPNARRWARADELESETEVLVLENGETTVRLIESVVESRVAEMVYNISVGWPHNYFANGVLVHNY